MRETDRLLEGIPPRLSPLTTRSRTRPGTGSRIRELFRAFLRAETYRPDRNPFVWAGFLWGVPVPVATIGVALIARRSPLSIEAVWACLRGDPIQWWFLLHPLFFAALFGALGTLARDRDRKIDGLIDRLRTLADTDGLTGLFNHRAFQERVREEAARADREKRPIALLLADLDRFKDFNDRHGHPSGDRLLESVAARIQLLVRPYDIACRYGGEEFAVILPGMGAEEALRTAERLRAGISGEPFALPGIPRAGTSLSVGLATRRPGEPASEWVERADRRLYRAKAAGRNRVCFEGDSPDRGTVTRIYAP